MGATTLTNVTTINPNNTNIHGPVLDEVQGLIKVYKDGHVERPQVVPCVDPSLPLELGVACSDVCIDKLTNVWARLYVPMKTTKSSVSKLPLLVYFHGGGFCIGSASWSCYHEFLARLSARSRGMVMSVDYRLAPENPLPAAYEDGVNAILWLIKARSDNLWAKLCDFDRIFLAGDSSGGNIAHHVAARLAATDDLAVLKIEGTILIQPFFGGEARTESERRVGNNKSSGLTLAASDAWWRLALPRDATRDHPYCKPVKIKSTVNMRTLVCVAEMDLLMDRNMEMCDDNEKMIKRVVFRGVGHAFHILGKSQLAHTTTLEMLCHIDAFIHNYDPL
ncbi:putative carboxylesterase 6 [Cardamine amara subsp. amara]|uniref:Carboxylesterase 6 n=1 Tax=Cardamine amara subsp. amara TaxID=228776 RepID=A0ABD1C1G1_CARAN